MKYLTIILSAFLLSATAPTGPDEIVLDGFMEPWRTVIVRSSADGILSEVGTERGQVVKENDLVATLAFTVEQADLEIAKAKAENQTELELAKAELTYKQNLEKTNRALFTKGIINRDDFMVFENDRIVAALKVRQKEASMRNAELEYQRSKAKYALRSIHAPIAGLVTKKMKVRGEMVTRTGDCPILEIAEMKRLAVDVHVPVALIREIKVGMSATVVAEDLGDQKIPAKVKIVNKVADAASGTFQIRIEVDNTLGKLPAGLRCRVYLQPQD